MVRFSKCLTKQDKKKSKKPKKVKKVKKLSKERKDKKLKRNLLIDEIKRNRKNRNHIDNDFDLNSEMDEDSSSSSSSYDSSSDSSSDSSITNDDDLYQSLNEKVKEKNINDELNNDNLRIDIMKRDYADLCSQIHSISKSISCSSQDKKKLASLIYSYIKYFLYSCCIKKKPIFDWLEEFKDKIHIY